MNRMVMKWHLKWLNELICLKVVRREVFLLDSQQSNIVCYIFEAYKTKVSRNENMGKLQAGYLFPEVHRISLLQFISFMRSLGIAFQTTVLATVERGSLWSYI